MKEIPYPVIVEVIFNDVKKHLTGLCYGTSRFSPNNMIVEIDDTEGNAYHRGSIMRPFHDKVSCRP